ncbi:MAG: hypothetical protein JRI72_17555 [Deltaproteobacteria bacterium]|nr:hypothetical protein [Deltaproteobacteria bacterium]
MVRIIGNSPERVKITDLGDVIYYRQEKDYTDQEYEQSKDLQKELKKGNVVKLEEFQSARSAGGGNNGSVTIKQEASPVSLQDIKQAIREALPRNDNASSGFINTVRQEMSSVMSHVGMSRKPKKSYQDPAYIPDVSTDGMVANIEVKEKEVSGNSMGSALEALKRMKSK